MARFCPNCGSRLEDNVLFCSSCGTKVEIQPEPQPQPQYAPQPEPQYAQPEPQYAQPQPQYQQAQPQYQQAQPQYQQAQPQYQQAQPQYQQAQPQYQQAQPQYQQAQYAQTEPQPQYQYGNYGYQAAAPAPQPKKSKKKWFIIGGIALALIIAVVAVYFLMFSPQAVAKRFIGGFLDGDAKQVINCMPDFLYEDKAEAIEDLEETFEYLDFEDYDISYKVVGTTDLDKDGRDGLKYMLELYEASGRDFKASDVNVDKAKVVTIAMEYEGETETFEIVVVPYKGFYKVFESEFGM